MDKQREQFEAWVLQGGTHPGAIVQDDVGYVVSVTAACWDAWQAATAAERERAAKVADSMNTFGLPPDVAAAIRAG
jgi:hypothetical protein